jgi:hypothetical protein
VGIKGGGPWQDLNPELIPYWLSATVQPLTRTVTEPLPGERKVFFSSYYQGVKDVCFIHAVLPYTPHSYTPTHTPTTWVLPYTPHSYTPHPYTYKLQPLTPHPSPAWCCSTPLHPACYTYKLQPLTPHPHPLSDAQVCCPIPKPKP